MKRIIALLLSILLLTTYYSALAEGGVVVLQTPETEQETLTMDDVKNGATYNIDGYAEVTIMERGWQNKIGQYSYGDSWRYYYESGTDAEYYILKVNILNTQFSSVVFKKEFGSIVASYGNGYKFGGWVEQLSEKSTANYYYEMTEGKNWSTNVAPLYSANYYVIVCLPNVVKARTEPLSITFTLGENEFTYHVRK